MRGSTTSRMPVTRAFSPGRTTSKVAERTRGILLGVGREPFGIHLQDAGVIARLPAEADLAHAVLCQLKAVHG